MTEHKNEKETLKKEDKGTLEETNSEHRIKRNE
jgi:hypothetical protein